MRGCRQRQKHQRSEPSIHLVLIYGVTPALLTVYTSRSRPILSATYPIERLYNGLHQGRRKRGGRGGPRPPQKFIRGGRDSFRPPQKSLNLLNLQ